MVDWYIVEKIIYRNMSCSPHISFRILGWVCLAGQKWVDIIRIKRFKQTNGRSTCYHPHICCVCGEEFVKQHFTNDRPFLNKINLHRQDNKFMQVSIEMELLLCKIDLKIASVLCTDRITSLLC